MTAGEMPEGMTRRDVRWAFVGILCMFFAAMLAMNIIITALPVIVRQLEGTQIQYSWVVIANLLANASSTPIWGKLADTVSKKSLFQCAAGLFIFSCVAAGFAQTMEMLLAARALQGVAMGGIGALTMAIMGSIVAPRERGRYAGYIGACLTTATAAGPLLGGLTVDTLGWRWCFFVGLPVSLLAFVVVHRTLQLPAGRRRSGGRIDYMGACLLTVSSSVLLVWLSFVGVPEHFPWVSWQSVGFLAAAVVLLTLFVLVEHRSVDPLVSLRMLADRTTFLAVISSASIAICLIGMPAFIIQYFQVGRGFSPTESGLMTFPLIVGNLVGSMVTGRLITRYGRWKVHLVAGSLLLSTAMFALSAIGQATSLWLVLGLLFLAGLGFGAQMQNLMVVVQNTVPLARVGQASALVAFFRLFGGAASMSLLGSMMAMQVGGHPAAEADGAGGSAVYAEASGTLFLVAACVTLPAVLANMLIREVPLRTTL